MKAQCAAMLGQQLFGFGIDVGKRLDHWDRLGVAVGLGFGFTRFHVRSCREDMGHLDPRAGVTPKLRKYSLTLTLLLRGRSTPNAATPPEHAFKQ